jgi:predicted Zn-dependent peptidase
MKSFVLAASCLIFSFCAAAQSAPGKGNTHLFEAVPNDPLRVLIYRLPNGFSVYMSVNKDQPRIQTYMAVRTGSRNDPPDATGLAHYLEHQLFKGSETLGTLDYKAEKACLDRIEALYEKHRATADTLQKKRIYHQIDSLSGIAATYSVANEYDRLVSVLGAKGTNAFTSYDQTVYTNDIPSNQLENFIKLEADRFRNPVLRRFHTELEAVYEEKNRGLDSDGNQAFEQLMQGLLPGHPYGTQTTIGTIAHLKNPSITSINTYLTRYYVPENMALVLSGDFDPEEVASLVDTYYGDWNKKGSPAPVFNTTRKATVPVISTLSGPEGPMTLMAYAMKGANTVDADMMLLLANMLSNGKAGLFDTDINLTQKAGAVSAEAEVLNDFSLLFIEGKPLQGQEPDEILALVKVELEKLKTGDFPDWLLPATVNHIKMQRMRQFESNSGRGYFMMNAFIHQTSWKEQVAQIARLEKVTKALVMEFAGNCFGNNFSAVIKKMGDRTPTEKVSKPAITAVVTNSEKQSAGAAAYHPEQAKDIQPVFVDYGKDIRKDAVNGVPLYYVRNPQNSLFTLTFLLKRGKAQDRMLDPALSYMTFAGTASRSATAISQEYFKLGCAFGYTVDDNETKITVSGLQEHFQEALVLTESYFRDLQADKEALGKYIGQEKVSREDLLNDKNAILQLGMSAFGKYGSKNPFNHVLSGEELQGLSARSLKEYVGQLFAFQHELWYYGPEELSGVASLLQKHHQVPKTLTPAPENPFSLRQFAAGEVYYIHYPIKQVETLLLRNAFAFDTAKIALMRLHNSYFGTGLNSIVGQELREARALAYSVFSQLNPIRSTRLPLMDVSYIGTQADKLPEALRGFFGLLDTMPENAGMFAEACKASRQKIASERVMPRELLDNYYQARQWGLHHDIRRDVFETAGKITLQEMADFHKKSIAARPTLLMVVGDKKSILSSGIEKYGQVHELNKKEIFGFD